jgi:hypothetical protein
MIAFLVYFFSQQPIDGLRWLQDVPWQISPLVLSSLTIIVCIIFQLKSKFWLVNGIARIVAAPFIGVRFRDFFLGDQLCSLVLIFNDLQFTSCFMLWGAWNEDSSFQCQDSDKYTRPLIAALPFIWRFLQCCRRYLSFFFCFLLFSFFCFLFSICLCFFIYFFIMWLHRYRDEKDWHQLANAGKYVSSLVIVLTSAMRGAEEGMHNFFFVNFHFLCYLVFLLDFHLFFSFLYYLLISNFYLLRNKQPHRRERMWIWYSRGCGCWL